MPRVSVVIPLFNGERYIRECVESVLRQTFGDLELIVVDDGSSDQGKEIVQACSDPRIRLLQHPANQGVANATNTGVDAAEGEYVALLDQDDIAYPQRLEKQVAFLDEHPRIAFVGGGMQCFGADHSEAKAPAQDAIIKANLLAGAGNLYNPTVMLRKSVLAEKQLRWNGEYLSAFDWAFYAEAMRKGVRFANLSEPLVKYRIHDAQYSRHQAQIRNVLQAIRLGVMQAYFPPLTPTQRMTLEPLLQWTQPPALERSEVLAGLALMAKARLWKKSMHGESREVVNNFLSACEQRWRHALQAPAPAHT